MAQAFSERATPPTCTRRSAGSEPRREGVWPTVPEATAEVGIDLSARRPRKFTVEMPLHADSGVTQPAAPPARPSRRPSRTGACRLGREAVGEVNAIGDAIEPRVRGSPSTASASSEATAPPTSMRLEKLLPVLNEEFAGVRSDAEMRACADAVLAEFADVPVPSHVMTLACKGARVPAHRALLRPQRELGPADHPAAPWSAGCPPLDR